MSDESNHVLDILLLWSIGFLIFSLFLDFLSSRKD
jgi:hypothetical protein